MDLKEFLVQNLLQFFRYLGTEPIYGITFILILIVFPYKKRIKNWENIPKLKREFYILGWIGAAIGIIVSVLRFLRSN